ncbi:MAG: DUF1540 domain-containing protein [Clostridia bacterium]|nr:DUF1540 domain-containing protein [Clostridia bacterium]
MDKNNCIRCDVCKCVHNSQGQNCTLNCIKVTCGIDGVCTRCGDYVEKD